MSSQSDRDTEPPRVAPGTNGFSLRYKSRNIYSPADPRGSAEQKALRFQVQPKSLLIVPSPLFMYGVETLLGRLDESNLLVCVERDPALVPLSEKYRDEGVVPHPLVVECYGDSEQAVLESILSVTEWRFRRVSLVPLNAGYGLSREFYDNLARLLVRYNQSHWQNRLTTVRMARLWIRNLFQNLSSFPMRTADELIHPHLPAVVVGAGESLETALEWIHEFRRSFTLFAVDTALPALIESDISPDFVVAVEGQILNYGDFLSAKPVDWAETGRGVRLIADLVSAPSVLRSTRTIPFFFLSSFGSISLLDRLRRSGLHPTSVPALGSVGVVAIHLALSMTEARIIMAGLDFSYIHGKTHARGTPSHLSKLVGANRISSLDKSVFTLSRNNTHANALGGGERLTNVVLDGYSSMVEGYSRSTSRLFDANPASILHEVPVVNRSELVHYLREFKATDPKPHGAANSTRTTGDREMVERFLSRELDLVRNVQSLCASPRSIELGSGKTELEKTLREADYLFFDFPDYGSTHAYDAGFLARVNASTFYYERLLQRALVIVQR